MFLPKPVYICAVYLQLVWIIVWIKSILLSLQKHTHTHSQLLPYPSHVAMPRSIFISMVNVIHRYVKNVTPFYCYSSKWGGSLKSAFFYVVQLFVSMTIFMQVQCHVHSVNNHGIFHLYFCCCFSTYHYLVLLLVQNHPSSWPFLEAVDGTQAPQYYDIVKFPMGMYVHNRFYFCFTPNYPFVNCINW